MNTFRGDMSKYKFMLPLKPPGLTISKEFTAKDIFTTMLRATSNINFFDYLDDNNKKKRNNVIRVIVNHLNKLKIPKIATFRFVYLFDMLINDESLVAQLDYELIGLGSLSLVMKFFCPDNKTIPLRKMSYIFSSSRYTSAYTVSQIIVAEILCMKACDYFLSVTDVYNFLNMILISGIVFNFDKGKSQYELNSNVYHTPYEILEKIMLTNYNYVFYNCLYLSCAIVMLTREKYGLDKWPTILVKTFNLSFETIKQTYVFVKETYNMNNNENVNNSKPIESTPTKIPRNKSVSPYKKPSSICTTPSISKNELLPKENIVMKLDVIRSNRNKSSITTERESVGTQNALINTSRNFGGGIYNNYMKNHNLIQSANTAQSFLNSGSGSKSTNISIITKLSQSATKHGAKNRSMDMSSVDSYLSTTMGTTNGDNSCNKNIRANLRSRVINLSLYQKKEKSNSVDRGKIAGFNMSALSAFYMRKTCLYRRDKKNFSGKD